MNRTQLFSLGAVVVFLGGTALAIKADRERRARAVAGASLVVREPDAFEPTSKDMSAPMSPTASDGTGLVLGKPSWSITPSSISARSSVRHADRRGPGA